MNLKKVHPFSRKGVDPVVDYRVIVFKVMEGTFVLGVVKALNDSPVFFAERGFLCVEEQNQVNKERVVL